MLVLRRRIGQKIRIDDNVTITINDVCGQYVVLGIEAPIEIPVHREEVVERIKTEGRRKRRLTRKE